jgi:hypothetical protein
MDHLAALVRGEAPFSVVQPPRNTMLVPLTLKEFYAETLKAAGFTPPEDSIAKFAETNKIDPEIVKIASAVFEQLTLDGVKYETPQLMADDAMKIATQYLEHCKAAAAEAEKIAGDLHRVARHAVEGYLAQHGIELDADEGVKIAGLQAQSFQELMQKQAELRQRDIEAKTAKMRPSKPCSKCKGAIFEGCEDEHECAKTAQDGDPLSDIANAMPGQSHKDKMKDERGKTAASPTPQSFAAYHTDSSGIPVAHNPKGTISNLSLHTGIDPKVMKSQIESSVGPENVENYGHKYYEAAQQSPANTPFNVLHPKVVEAVKANPAAAAAGAAGAGAAAAKPFLQRPGVMLGAGALGLGAAMLLHRKRQEALAAQNRQNAIAGAANLPPAA